MENQRFDRFTRFLAIVISRRRLFLASVTGITLAASPRHGFAAGCLTDDDCDAKAFCDGGFCFELDYLPPGSSCDGSVPCEGDYLCLDSVCSAPVTCQFNAGGDCDPAGGCCPGLICDNQGLCQVEQSGGGDGGDTPVDNGGGGGGAQSGNGNSGQETGGYGSNGATASSSVRLPTTGVPDFSATSENRTGIFVTLAALSTAAALRVREHQGKSTSEG